MRNILTEGIGYMSPNEGATCEGQMTRSIITASGVYRLLVYGCSMNDNGCFSQCQKVGEKIYFKVISKKQ